MVYEKKIATTSQLSKELLILDLDAGIRIAARYASRQCLAFVTRSAAGFTVMIYTLRRGGREPLPDKRLLAKDFSDAKQAEEFLFQVATRPLRAYAY